MNRLKRVIMCVVLFTCLNLASVAPGKIIYVDDDATGASNEGSSWAMALTYLQPALSVARAGDEIRVAQGLYHPDEGLSMTVPTHGGPAVVSARGSITAAFQLKNGVALRGGFAGWGAEDPNARDPDRYPTILNGDLRGDDIDLWGPGNPLYDFFRADNSENVVQSLRTDATAVLDGFVVESAVDAGLFNQEGSPTITNCVFQKCTTLKFGAGLRCEKGQPTLSNCVFQNNHAVSAYNMGGAVYGQGARLTLSDCRFCDNDASQEGGAICSVDGDLTLTRCTFETNWAKEGGAIHQTAGTLTLVECTFETNAANDGGAVAFAVEAASMTRCVFRGNWALATGGALENGESPLTLDGCVFSGNTAGMGGALYAFRLTGWPLVSSSATAVTRCLFTGNRAWNAGGAVSSGGVDLTVRGCTFAGNFAPVAGTLGWWPIRAGDALYRVRMENCIVWDGIGSITRSASSRPPSRTSQDIQPEVLIRYCDMQTGWPGEGNFTADPCFADPGHWVDGTNPKIVVDSSSPSAVWVEGDYHLRSQAGRWDPASEDWILDAVTSPCIDAGDPNSPVGDEPEPNGGRINLGAYGGTAEASKSHF
jgi:hypothetical protein